MSSTLGPSGSNPEEARISELLREDSLPSVELVVETKVVATVVVEKEDFE